MILVDTHVHMYDLFPLEAFLDSVHSNFRAAAEQLGAENTFQGICLLMAREKEKAFARLMARPEDSSAGGTGSSAGWRIRETGERMSVRIRSGTSKELYIIAGRQIVTTERIEVLAIGLPEDIPRGLSTRSAVETVRRLGGIPILPWGFGKWAGKRGKVVNGMLRVSSHPGLFLGDSSSRPSFWRPPQFKLAGSRGIHILPGTDPLPLSSEYRRAGSFGMVLDGTVSSDFPAEGLKQRLTEPSLRVQPYGRRLRLWPSLYRQMAIRLKREKSPGS